jgi:hypothetical protein
VFEQLACTAAPSREEPRPKSEFSRLSNPPRELSRLLLGDTQSYSLPRPFGPAKAPNAQHIGRGPTKLQRTCPFKPSNPDNASLAHKFAPPSSRRTSYQTRGKLRPPHRNITSEPTRIADKPCAWGRRMRGRGGMRVQWPPLKC